MCDRLSLGCQMVVRAELWDHFGSMTNFLSEKESLTEDTLPVRYNPHTESATHVESRNVS